MYVMQLAYVKNIDKDNFATSVRNTVENVQNRSSLVGENIKEENVNNDLPNKIKNQLKNTNQVKANPIKSQKTNFNKFEISSFQDLIDKTNIEKEVELKFDLERNVKLVSFNKGKIDISFNEKLNKNFIKNLTEKLLLWTGDRWIISLSKNNDAKSIYDQNMEKKSSELKKFNESDLAAQIKETFPDAKLIDIQENSDD